MNYRLDVYAAGRISPVVSYYGSEQEIRAAFDALAGDPMYFMSAKRDGQTISGDWAQAGRFGESVASAMTRKYGPVAPEPPTHLGTPITVGGYAVQGGRP